LVDLEEAVQRILKGDASAFQRIVDHTSARLVRLSARIMGNAADAEDVVQEAYVKAYRSIVEGGFDGRSKVETWLYRIVVNATIDAKRSRKHDATPMDTLPDPGWDGARSAEAHLALVELEDLLRDLPEDQHAAIILKSVEGLSAAEVGAVLHTSEGAVEQLLVRARTTLRQKRDLT
jgi:RNA polymerase sigma-70 factor (ECF subfamily)